MVSMSDLTRQQLRGPVQSVTRELAEWNAAQDGWGPARELRLETYRRDGQLAERNSHNPDGSIVRWVRLFDDAGREIEDQFWHDDKLGNRTLYTYDAQGRAAEVTAFDGEGHQRLARTNVYDGDRRTSIDQLPSFSGLHIAHEVEDGSGRAYNAPGAVTRTTTYDARGHATEVQFQDANQTVVLRITLAHDDAGHLLHERVYFTGPSPFPFSDPPFRDASPADREKLAALMNLIFSERTFSEVSNTWDARGRLIEGVHRMGLLSEERMRYQYDEYDNVIELTTNSHSCEIKNDEAGQIQTQEETWREQVNRMEYVYDAHGNWIERVCSYCDNASGDFRRTNIERRTFTYYD
jgi:YD repeat-containing protein